MKEFKVEMTRRLVELASNPIRTKNNIIILLLEAIPLLTYGEPSGRPTKEHVILRFDKMQRLFFVLEDKYFSFKFPFNIDTREQQINPVIYDSVTELEINGKNLAAIKLAYEEIFVETENQGILELDSELLHIMEIFEMEPNKDHLWVILKNLLKFESGYLRYDYDEKHENGRLHPLNHLDINYSSGNTFKIGVNCRISSEMFIDILNINTNSYYISE
ncbi:hypothetical protein GCM10010954_15890 [Halobacillus andaensis]|uniref:Uncharacterized protein n=1 Tax=Halobacillus andaensis TaxID=1176239 RepID=A0A917B309_HALAA|nr:hypothetical protein [Halobacillus andaensis]MBP2004911.1 hypothetical protein [Halobacillus andaensis]GGF17940.1 hypothetical protein GCM10010954_15890 [Halobacillus andaensis]